MKEPGLMCVVQANHHRREPHMMAPLHHTVAITVHVNCTHVSTHVRGSPPPYSKFRHM